MLQTVRAEKVDAKNGINFSKKSKSVKVIYIYTSERSRYALSENDIVLRAIDVKFLTAFRG